MVDRTPPTSPRGESGAARRRSCCALALLGLASLAIGCSGGNDAISGGAGDATHGEASLQGVTLQLLVVGDPPLAESISQLEGQWQAELGGRYEVAQMTVDQLRDAKAISADAVIVPCCRLGLLAECGEVMPIPRAMLAPYDAQWSEMFDLPRLHEAAWGTEILAVPLGSPVLCCYYRPDLLEKVGRKPPATWAEYQELVEMLSDRSRLGDSIGAAGDWSATIEPLAPGWAGQTLLARAAPYAKHADRYSTLFDIESMEPLVAGPPFVRALEGLVAAAEAGPSDPLSFDPDAVRQAFWEGRCGLALSWPTSAAQLRADGNAEAVPCGFAALPGSREAYDGGEKAWTERPNEADGRVPLLSVSGRLGCVRAKSAHPEAALRLLFWVAAKQGADDRKIATTATTLFRESDLKSPQLWVEPPVKPEAAAQYGEVLEQTLRSRQWLECLRIPGHDEYMAALDAAVAQAVRGAKSPEEALRGAADRWRETTGRLGVDRQRQAYLHSLGLE